MRDANSPRGTKRMDAAAKGPHSYTHGRRRGINRQCGHLSHGGQVTESGQAATSCGHLASGQVLSLANEGGHTTHQFGPGSLDPDN